MSIIHSLARTRTTTESSLDLCHLPPELLSSILSSFCSGKSLSTFFQVLQGCSAWIELLPCLIRDTLVRRYKILSERFEGNAEITDVLVVIRQDIRNAYDNEDLLFQPTRHYSEWCAILDYFELQLLSPRQQPHQFIMWCGPLVTHYGVMQGYLKSTNWTATAMEFWYTEFELFQFSLGIPPRNPPLVEENRYGIIGACFGGETVMERVYDMLNPENDELGRYTLVPRHLDFEAEPSVYFTKCFESERSTLHCYWDEDDNIDWELGIERLGDNAIRVMNRIGPSFPLPVGDDVII